MGKVNTLSHRDKKARQRPSGHTRGHTKTVTKKNNGRVHPSQSQVDARFVRALRRRLGWSASRFAIEVGGHSRSYIKSIEGGSLPVSGSLAEEIQELHRKMFPHRKQKRWRTMFVIFV
jgi:hypothetical protein